MGLFVLAANCYPLFPVKRSEAKQELFFPFSSWFALGPAADLGTCNFFIPEIITVFLAMCAAPAADLGDL